MNRAEVVVQIAAVGGVRIKVSHAVRQRLVQQILEPNKSTNEPKRVLMNIFSLIKEINSHEKMLIPSFYADITLILQNTLPIS